MKFFYKAILIFTGFLAVSAGMGYFYLTRHSREILQNIVSKATHDTYRLEAKSINFFLWNTGISGEKIKLIPNTVGNKQATLTLEKVEFRLQSLWHLVFNRSLEVKTIEIIQPDLTAWAKQNSGSAKKGISETIYEIQLKIFELIHALKVEKVLLSDASLKIFGTDTAAGSFLSINHLTLKLDDIEILPSLNDTTPQIKLDGSLTLLNPTIHLPDTNIVTKLGKLEATLANRSLAIDELDFSITNANNQNQKLTLSSIRVNQFNWDRYVKEGIIELDTIMANKGIAKLNLSKKEMIPSKDTGLQKKGYQGASILIHHTIISDVAYTLNKEDTKNGKNKQVSLNLQGDNLYLENFSLINGRQPAFDVEKLAIALRDVKQGDNKGDMRFSLGAVLLDSSSLVLKNLIDRKSVV